MVKKRANLNEMIAKHQQERLYVWPSPGLPCHPQADRLLSHAFDLWSVVRYTGIDDEMRERIWDDGLHLTAEGYSIMGKAVAAHLFKLIRNADPVSKSKV